MYDGSDRQFNVLQSCLFMLMGAVIVGVVVALLIRKVYL